MKFFFLFLVLFLTSLSHASDISCTDQTYSAPFKKNEGFPWPWSHQCEFDWERIRGSWQIAGNDIFNTEYKMEVYNLNQSGENFLMVVQYDEDGIIVARGLALPSNHQRGVMVPMQWMKESDGINGYWIHLSWVVSGNIDFGTAESICRSGRGNVELAAKITVFGQNQDDRPPKILKKVISKAP